MKAPGELVPAFLPRTLAMVRGTVTAARAESATWVGILLTLVGLGLVFYTWGPDGGRLAKGLDALGKASLPSGVSLCLIALAATWPSGPALRPLAFYWRHPVVQPLVVAAGLVAAGTLLVLTFPFLVDPVASLVRVQQRILELATVVLFAGAGLVSGGTRSWSMRRAALVVLLAGIGVVTLWSPQSGIFRLGVDWLAPPVLGLLAGVLLGKRIDGLAPPRELTRAARFGLVGVFVLLAVPGTVGPVIKWWGISGYMDSHAYDVAAHMIAVRRVLQGNSFVMPLYQYGMATIYFALGHFFYVQQIANIVLQLASVALLVLSAYRLFNDYRAAVLMGLLAALTAQFRLFVMMTQIENWYLPLISLIIFTWVRYRERPTLGSSIALATAIGLAFNCRSQGAFFFALMCLAPFAQAGTALRTKLIHTLVIGAVVGATLVPWSVRNYVYEGRFSPSSDQATIGLLFNDHRVGFYGLRFDLYSWQTVLTEYEAKYPDKAERFTAIQHDAIANTVGDPVWWAHAFGWRTLAFYGLLPPGVWGPNGVVPTNWRAEWLGYIYNASTPVVLIVTSLIGLALQPRREGWFLFGAIFANLAVMLVASQREARISFPVFPLHMLLALCAVFPMARAGVEPSTSLQGWRLRWRYGLMILAVLAVILVLSRVLIGRPNQYAPLLEAIVVSPTALETHQQLGLTYRDVDPAQFKSGLLPAPGDRIRVRVRVSNYMLPPKSAGAVDYLPLYASDPAREQYFYAPVPDSTTVLGITYFGAVAGQPIREYDEVTVEGRVLEGKAVPLLAIPFWIHAEAIYK